ncbi:MAG: glycosyltransferase, partial [Helicobacter sp.]|nr:glycosyltransferase [Helicobacter sp.]
QDKHSAPPEIDYIIFLDSDDYWREDCVQECLKAFADSKAQGKQAEVVMIDYYSFSGEKPNQTFYTWTWNHRMGFTQQCTITPSQFVQHIQDHFAFGWRGMIDFHFLQEIGLYFLAGVLYEDTNFGIMLFLQAKNIHVIMEKLYYYRIRENSITTSVTTAPSAYLKTLSESFDNPKQFNTYKSASSWFLLSLQLIDFCETLQDKILRAQLLQKIFPYYFSQSLLIFESTRDPLLLREKLPLLISCARTCKLPLYQRIIIRYPSLALLIITLQKFYKSITMLTLRPLRLAKRILKALLRLK